MKKVREMEASQFNSCHATICDFVLENGAIFKIFYSYACPELIRFPDGLRCKFTYENSRKSLEKTSSRTTSKQLAKFKRDWRDFRTFNLWKFEELYFDTRLERYY